MNRIAARAALRYSPSEKLGAACYVALRTEFALSTRCRHSAHRIRRGKAVGDLACRADDTVATTKAAAAL
jgi:hypothetical protein